MLKKLLVCIMVITMMFTSIGGEYVNAASISNPYGSCDGETHHDSQKFRKLIQVKKLSGNNY
ncbi:MAG: hypothetical protein K6G85_05225, partial [Eubacterium sp.]|nr:hypothetical protein [Eubacterium sp.]